jgi:uncharacterized protein (TIGR02271 family)
MSGSRNVGAGGRLSTRRAPFRRGPSRHTHRFEVGRTGNAGATMSSSDRSGLFGAHPTDALIALLVVALAVVAATTADLEANEAWTLVAGLAAAYIVGRGLSRGDWLAVARRRHRPAHMTLPGKGDGDGDGNGRGDGDGRGGIAEKARALASAVTPDSKGDGSRDSKGDGSRDSTGDGGRDSAEITLHEERVHVESRSRPRERVVVRKHVITEHVSVTVPLRREELRIERVPLDAPRDAGAELDVTLMEDEPVVHTHTVATERFRASKEAVTEQREVGATVRREEADIDITPTNEETSA